VFFRQVVHEDLGCASYVIADGGEAVVVDPKWDIDAYLELAADAGAKIGDVLETHFHADHVSGRVRLAAATGARVRVPFDAARPADGGLRSGDVITAGDVSIEAIAAPGHRPEHLAFLVTDRGANEARRLLLAGDSLLVGGLARPDLAVDAQSGAEALFDTARRLVDFGDELEVWPGHVGGSLCGAGTLSDETSSTIGTELSRNPLLSIDDRPAFVAEITRTIPVRPPQVAKVVALNMRGAESPGPLRVLDRAEFSDAVGAGACILDVRASDAFDRAHLEGAMNLPASGKGIGTRAGWVTADGEAIVLVAPSLEVGTQVGDLLLAGGVWGIAGIAIADPAAWSDEGLAVLTVGALSPDEVVSGLAARDLEVVDVRDPHEWRAGHVAGSIHLPLSTLRDGRDCDASVPPGELAVVCARGPRAALAASVLRRRGHAGASRLAGGITDLVDRGIPLVTR
jgi:hydroxyacylglutathione hydrolase